MFRILVFIAALLFPIVSYAEQSDTQITYEVISRIYIKMRVDDDNKIPKQDRKKWEERLSDYVDFESLNNVMRDNVREALKKEKENVNQENIEYIAEKGVSFYLPKFLRGYTHAFLKVQDELDELPNCENNPQPSDEQKVIICTSRIKNNLIYAYMIAVDKPENRSNFYTFKKTDRWRLTGLYTPISEEAIKMLAVWK